MHLITTHIKAACWPACPLERGGKLELINHFVSRELSADQVSLLSQLLENFSAVVLAGYLIAGFQRRPPVTKFVIR